MIYLSGAISEKRNTKCGPFSDPRSVMLCSAKQSTLFLKKVPEKVTHCPSESAAARSTTRLDGSISVLCDESERLLFQVPMDVLSSTEMVKTPFPSPLDERALTLRGATCHRWPGLVSYRQVTLGSNMVKDQAGSYRLLSVACHTK